MMGLYFPPLSLLLTLKKGLQFELLPYKMVEKGSM